MKENKTVTYIVASTLTVFGLMTFYLSGSVIFDLFGIREQEGRYILFVVWANFICSFLYLISSLGLIKRKQWSYKLINYAFIILLSTLSGLYIHIETGGAYEIKTIYGMIFRIALTFTFLVYIKLKTSQWKKL